ncbi:MAG TPA: alpha/beta fold hydrolase [Terriglobales bacterium]|nr:alpha/beta fold hydrolase [Terriglobales bacterium]
MYEFGPFRLEVEERRCLKRGQPVRLRGKVFDTLAALVTHHGRLLRKDELLGMVWPDTIVEENNLDHTISRLRKALGDQGQYIETVPRQGYRFVAPVTESDRTAAPPAVVQRPPQIPEQKICFFTTDDGVRIAYSTAGSGPPLVKAANWLNHLEFEWKSPIWRHWIPELTRRHTLIRYDERGNGLSDWNIQDFSFEAWVRDFDQLIDTLGLKHFALLGISQGGAVAVSYAVRHPERVSRMILYGAFARGWSMRNAPQEVERRTALLTLIKFGWGKDNPAFRQLWSSLFTPDAPPEQFDWFNELQRVTTSPENAVELLSAGGRINVVDLLPSVRCPTLVLHSAGDAVVPIAEGRLLASRIPGARFVELPSRNHLVMAHEPAWKVFTREVRSFLEEDAAQYAGGSLRLVRGGRR